ncbi:MAG: Pyridoxamine 5'-phosphate oxidase, partial [uncultured Thermomicrobiales bacterium]
DRFHRHDGTTADRGHQSRRLRIPGVAVEQAARPARHQPCRPRDCIFPRHAAAGWAPAFGRNRRAPARWRSLYRQRAGNPQVTQPGGEP